MLSLGKGPNGWARDSEALTKTDETDMPSAPKILLSITTTSLMESIELIDQQKSSRSWLTDQECLR